MPMNESGPATSMREIDRWEGGVGWFAYPNERMQRASHALATDEGVYVVDPVDATGVDDLLAEFGEVAGVVVVLDRHRRDSAAVANRHGVPVYVPDWMGGVASKLDAPTERLGAELGTTGYEVRRLVDNPFWQEAALYHPGEGTLLVPESLGTVDFFRSYTEERLGVHPVLRLTPPRSLASLSVERLLVGHGTGVFEDPETAIARAVRGATKRAPGLYLKTLRNSLPV